MAALLPPGGTPTINGRDGSAGEGGAAGGGVGSSKASTVEVAIEYIKALQVELKQTKTKLEAAEEKLREGCGEQAA